MCAKVDLAMVSLLLLVAFFASPALLRWAWIAFVEESDEELAQQSAAIKAFYGCMAELEAGE